MDKDITYSVEQIANVEKAISILGAMPESIRDIAAMVTAAYIDGLQTGQRLNGKVEQPKETA